ncbi:MAG: permease-like cell division protein FtsX [Coriobacteriales bacterium]|jgi:cell division transport system permease protein|nr:permease-like cell division protein FtsX [Coriobacteriales bacterium]
MRSIFYFIKEALSNSKKNFGTTFGAIVTIFLSLLVIGVFMVMSLIVERVLQGVEDQVSIQVFLNDNASKSDIDALQSFITSQPEVASVRFVSKDEALEHFKQMSNPDIIEQLGSNPLPASLDVELRDPEKVKSVVEQISAQSIFMRVVEKPDKPQDSLRYGQQIVDQLFAVTNTVRIVAVALVVMLIFVALVFINNTIRLAILARRKEIAIMRLVGASNGFIRGPFIMEGALQALVGAGLAILVIWLLVSSFLPQIRMLISWLPNMDFWQVYALLLVVGLIIGLFGSMWAMRRYLRV